MTALGLGVTATYAAQAFAVANALDRVLSGRPFRSTLPIIALVLAMQAIRSVLLWWRERVTCLVGAQARAALRRELYGHLLDLGPAYTTARRTGDITTTLVDNVEATDHYFGRFLPQVATSASGAIVLTAIIFSIDVVTGLIVAISAAVAFFEPIVTRLLARRQRARQAQRYWSNLYRSVYSNSLDAIQGMGTLKAFNAHGRMRAKLREDSERFNRASVRLVAAASIPAACLGLATVAGTGFAVAVGALRLADGQITMAQLLVVLTLTRECFRPLTDLENAYHECYAVPALAERIFEMLDTPPRTALPPPVTAVDEPLSSSLAFDDVTFRYRPDAPPALDGVSFAVEPGQTVALVGRSGSGKSTVVALALRFFHPDDGRVLVGGRDLRDLDPARARAQFAVVSQDTFLFHGSIRENLEFARRGATLDELVDACRSANAHDFIEALPDGYETTIGERGMKLSGGQRQRLAIARALLKNAPILVLDEATSAVDGESEAAIQAALRTLSHGRSTLVIAHRLSTVRDADRIVMLDGGRRVEHGTNDELLSAQGAYARLVEAQVEA